MLVDILTNLLSVDFGLLSSVSDVSKSTEQSTEQARDFHPWVTVDQASATESHYILVGLTLKVGHCITAFELG